MTGAGGDADAGAPAGGPSATGGGADGGAGASGGAGSGTFLERIVAERRAAVRQASRTVSAADLVARAAVSVHQPRAFAAALRAAAAPGRVAVIAEIKRASPSKGPLRLGLDPVDTAKQYAQGGAAALSVLTEPAFFRAQPDDLPRARAASGLPTLRKEFVVDPWQLYETVALGADAVLLITAILGPDTAAFVDRAFACGIEPLVEVHDADELAVALETPAELIGINNRDLRTFAVDTGTVRRLAPAAASAGRVVVAESGIAGPDDLRGLRALGVTAVLVGESLLRADDPVAAVRLLAEADAGVD